MALIEVKILRKIFLRILLGPTVLTTRKLQLKRRLIASWDDSLTPKDSWSAKGMQNLGPPLSLDNID
jgi:hypothetical protein